MKKQQKTETPQNTTKTSPFLDKNAISENKNMKNEANFNSTKLTATSYTTMVYNNLQPKPQNGTNPNEPNFRRSRRSLGEDGYITNTRPNFNAELFAVNPCFFKTLFLGNKPNFLNPRITTTTCKRGTYNDIPPKTHKKNKPNSNPILDAKPISKNPKKQHPQGNTSENQTQSKPKPNPNPICGTYSVAKTFSRTHPSPSRTQNVHWTPKPIQTVGIAVVVFLRLRGYDGQGIE